MDSHSQGTLIRASIKELKSMYCCDNYSEYGTMHTWGFVSLKPTVVERDTEKGYEAVDQCQEELLLPYKAIASLLGCNTDEIGIVTSATEAWQQIVYGLAWNWRPGDVIITTLAEYGSNFIAFLQLSKRTGVCIAVIPEGDDGDVNLEVLEDMLAGNFSKAYSVHHASFGDCTEVEYAWKMAAKPKKPVLVAITHVPTSSGKVYNALGIGRLSRLYNIPYLLDACQSVGQMPVHVKDIGCDFLTATGRKYLRAPRGTGFIYCRSEALAWFEPATLDNTGALWNGRNSYVMKPDSRRFESYEISFAAKCGLGSAAQQCITLGINNIWERIQMLSHSLRTKLKGIRKVEMHDDGQVLCGIISFTCSGLSCSSIATALRRKNVNVSVSRRPSTRLKFEHKGITEVIRASVHYYNTEEELCTLVDALEEICHQ